MRKVTFFQVSKTGLTRVPGSGVSKSKPGFLEIDRFRIAAKVDLAPLSFAARWAGVLTIVDGHSICPPKLGDASVDGAMLIRPDGYLRFQTEKWNPEARSALDGFLNIQFNSAGI